MGITDLQLPEAFLERLAHVVPEERLEEVLISFTKKRPTTLRANTLKITPDDLRKRFDQSGIRYEGVAWNSIAFVLFSPTLREFTETDIYKNGLCYVQSLSSMIPPLILSPSPGDRVLDIAAAPGSKTTQMAAMMNNMGELVANDTSHIRRYRLEANVRMQGVTIATIEKEDGRAIWKRYPEYFDKVLVDAPCSMEGRFYTPDPKTYKDWSTKKVKILSSLQRWMLRSAISATKIGGTIVYSTCTLSPEENEEVIDWILRKEKTNVELENFSIPQLNMAPALDHWKDRHLDPRVIQCKRIYPSSMMEGFFIAKLKKIHSSIPPAIQE